MTKQEINELATQWVKKKANLNKLIKPMCDKNVFLRSEKPTTILMAGCTGAGKTEFSKQLLKTQESIPGIKKFIRADVDEFYLMLKKELNLPKATRDDLNFPCIKLVERLADCALRNKQNLLIDSSFSQKKAFTNVERSLKKNRVVHIYFIYEQPNVAWSYVLKREKFEGRSVPKDFFIKTYLGSIEMIKKVLQEFGSQIIIDIYQKEHERKGVLISGFKKLSNVESIAEIDKIVHQKYNRQELLEMIK